MRVTIILCATEPANAHTQTVGVGGYSSSLHKRCINQSHSESRPRCLPTRVSLTLARDDVAPFSSRELDRRPSAVEARRRSARNQTTRTKPEIALAEIDRVTAAGVRFGCVLADAGYG